MKDTKITKSNASQIMTSLMNENFSRGMSIEKAVDAALVTSGITIDAGARLHIIREAERNINAHLRGDTGRIEIVGDTKEYARITDQTVDQVEEKVGERN